MGVVVAAMHVELDQRVALKFLLPQATVHEHVVARFAREAKAAAKIQSEHVARVLDVGTLPSGVPFVVMEFMEGEDLARILSRRGPLPVELAVGYLLETCEGMAEAHAMGIVHRDLKPANLFLATRPARRSVLKVLDFGISKSSFATSQGRLTKTSAVVGSPLYMSPEQLMSAKTVDVRSDIWALGVVLYELLTARMPFEADTLPEVIAAVMHRAHAPLHAARPEVPPGLEAVVDRCLSKEPTLRFANVAELARAVAPFGPPRSDLAVERVSQALGLDDLRPPPAERTAPFSLTTVRIAPPESVQPATTTEPLRPMSPFAPPIPAPPTAVEPSAELAIRPTLGPWQSPRGARVSGYDSTPTPSATTSRPPPPSPEPAWPASLRSGRRNAKATAAIVGVLVVLGVGTSLWRSAPPHDAASENSLNDTRSPQPPTPSVAPMASEAVATAAPPATAARAATGGNSAVPPQAKEASFFRPAPVRQALAPHSGSSGSSTAQEPASNGSMLAFLNIDSTPASLVLVDGASIGSTPKLRFPVPPGSHSVVFLGSGEGFRREVSVTVAAGESRDVVGSSLEDLLNSRK